MGPAFRGRVARQTPPSVARPLPPSPRLSRSDIISRPAAGAYANVTGRRRTRWLHTRLPPPVLVQQEAGRPRTDGDRCSSRVRVTQYSRTL